MAFAFLSCGEDRTYEFLAKTEVDNWIEAQMREIYLYYREIPQLETEDYFSPAEEFFPKLLASQDKYSYIEVPTETDAGAEVKFRNAIQTVTYGFDFVLTDDPTGSSRQVARVLQVLPQSPATAIGLQRGDFITEVNGNNVSSKNTGLLENGNGTVLTVSTLSADEEAGDLVWDDEATELTLPAAVHMENNPLFLYKVIEQDGRKTGYLVYNEFKAGINDGDASYLEQMLQIFQWFKQQGVTDFILDMRYNQGGQVTCAQLLASLLAPAGSLGQEFARFEFNDKRQDSNYSLNFLTEYANYNLNLDRLFIISGLYTASASEMMVKGVHSDPVPPVVGMQTSLAFLPICGKKRILLRISRKMVAMSRKASSGCSYMIHMIFAVSMAEPPPTAMMTSGWNSCILGKPFIASWIWGSTRISKNSAVSMPESRSWLIMASQAPS